MCHCLVSTVPFGPLCGLPPNLHRYMYQLISGINQRSSDDHDLFSSPQGDLSDIQILMTLICLKVTGRFKADKFSAQIAWMHSLNHFSQKCM